jgi:hypothetical protein
VRRWTTLSDEPDGTPGDDAEAAFVRDLEYEFQTTVPIETADQPDPHFPN